MRIAMILVALTACGEIKNVMDGFDAAPEPMRSALGIGCAADAECESGVCADGVCCDRACDDACTACNLEGHRGSCSPVAAGEICGEPTCDQAMERAAPTCDGDGMCVAASLESCGRYVCENDASCFDHCTSDAACSAGNVCAGDTCAPPSCTDGVRTAPETDVDCGGGTCPKCRGALTCAASSDCQSGTCNAGTCTEPTYAWKTTAFGTCSASSCALGQQSRTVWCERSDGTTVADTMCTGTRPVQSQTCTNTTGCTWFAGAYGTCSARCNGGTQTRAVYCRDPIGTQVPNNWCSGTAPIASQSCNPQPCIRYVVGEPSAAMGPCWSPPNCLGGYPAAPACPSGYAATRTEQACGNPNSPGGNWALQIFLQTVGYGCSNPSYVMGIVSRECTYQ